MKEFYLRTEENKDIRDDLRIESKPIILTSTCIAIGLDHPPFTIDHTENCIYTRFNAKVFNILIFCT